MQGRVQRIRSQLLRLRSSSTIQLCYVVTMAVRAQRVLLRVVAALFGCWRSIDGLDRLLCRGSQIVACDRIGRAAKNDSKQQQQGRKCPKGRG